MPDLAIIDCRVDCHYKQYKGYWAVIKGTTISGNVEVQVAGRSVVVMQSDLDPIDAPPSDFKDMAEKVNGLLARDDLDSFDKRILEMYLREQFFSVRQREILVDLWNYYQKKG